MGVARIPAESTPCPKNPPAFPALVGTLRLEAKSYLAYLVNLPLPNLFGWLPAWVPYHSLALVLACRVVKSEDAKAHREVKGERKANQLPQRTTHDCTCGQRLIIYNLVRFMGLCNFRPAFEFHPAT